MQASEILRAKRDGLELTADRIRWFVDAAVSGQAADYQVAAFLMAVRINGMTAAETSALTLAMRDSGRTIKFDGLPGPAVDKHSTGGVGDKVSIALMPIVAACGVPVPMVAGRGLGHTGGTLDKLESISGFNVQLSLERFEQIVREVGACVIGQTEELCPADRLFYSLRDVTETVDSLPLIVSSILCKKSAEGIDALVMDVKSGSGAFMRDDDEALELARALCDVGKELGLKVHALVTDMSQPLGRTVGNALELVEAVDLLRGEETAADFAQVTFELAAHMLMLGGKAGSPEEAKQMAHAVVADGRALDKFEQIVEAQEGDWVTVEDPSLILQAVGEEPFVSPEGGYVTGVDAELIGRAAVILGAGRRKASDGIDATVGFELHKKIGDPVAAGEPLLTTHLGDLSKKDAVFALLEKAYRFGPEPVEPPTMIRHVLSNEGES
ncbi:MAG: thymidine phosphorylase [Deltaproteobacteria bacterium]|nr:thymidine phosphorylase [bacterium]MCB9477923.1 thymidine phosphorylase [Deltaproteobacteria bacterium]MCB9488198.1 thymidine phosphorylase [Deltaproteobacteria bacterium]